MKRRKAARSAPYWNEVDRAILRGRADGLTFEQIGKALRMTRQAVHQRLAALRQATQRGPKAIGLEAVHAELQDTNRLLAALIVQVARTQTRDVSYQSDVLRGLGLTSRKIAEALGTTEANVNATKVRSRRRSAEAQSSDAVDPVEGIVEG